MANLKTGTFSLWRLDSRYMQLGGRVRHGSRGNSPPPIHPPNKAQPTNRTQFWAIACVMYGTYKVIVYKSLTERGRENMLYSTYVELI